MSAVISSSERILKRWKMHRHVLIKLVELLPESAATWRPWHNAMSTIELVHHLAWTPDFFFASIEDRKFTIPSIPSTLEETSCLLKNLTTEHEAMLISITKTDLARVVTVDGLNVTEPIDDILHRLIGHEIHHKGQLMMYARILNVQPPFYVEL
jgi:uncharacterized damage-inducible protein DinB